MSDSMRRDVRFAVRGLRRSPVFAIAVVLMLAVGIGSTTAIFAAIDAVFLNTLPVSAPTHLRKLAWTSRARAFARPMYGAFADAIIARGETLDRFPYTAYERLREQARGFASIACFTGANLRFVSERGFFNVLLVSDGYFETLGTRTALGRSFASSDD